MYLLRFVTNRVKKLKFLKIMPIYESIKAQCDEICIELHEEETV